MSFAALRWVLNHLRHGENTLRPSDRLVLMAIADHADECGARAFPSIHTLALMAGVSSREVVRALKRLERAGLLVILRRAGRRQANVYRLAMVTPGHDETTEIVTGGHRDSDRWSPPMVTGGHLIRSSDPISDPEGEGERIKPALQSGPPSLPVVRHVEATVELLRRTGATNAELAEVIRATANEEEALVSLLCALGGRVVERRMAAGDQVEGRV